MRKFRRNLAKLGLAVAAGATLPLLATPAWAVGTDLPGATLTDSTGAALTPGSPLPSTQTFKIILPNGAACTQSTAASGFHVGSFLVNQSHGDPNTYQYTAGGPTLGFGLSSTLGSLYENVSTNTDATINPGPVFNLKKQFASYVSGGTGTTTQLFAGNWNIGISCTDASSPANADNVWNIPVIFTDSSTDTNHFTWQVAPPASTPETPYAIFLPISAVGLIGGAYLFLRRRNKDATPRAA